MIILFSSLEVCHSYAQKGREKERERERERERKRERKNMIIVTAVKGIVEVIK